ncbi:hypothetical protein [Mesorhizobium sp. CA7]|uniref:hypothetical protein n=1 Tax=Mesorhizobium sp. CA7 TaxID=588501 RepID=UPI001CCE9D88|nr:hypothetical protein [Mesorhizobium sp. CA7]MBZ9812478.1 hypothetical protein [Mesorhizobium sp. CA7]
MNSKSTKAKRRKIPTYTIAGLEDAGKLPPFTYLMDPLDNWLAAQEPAPTLPLKPQEGCNYAALAETAK